MSPLLKGEPLIYERANGVVYARYRDPPHNKIPKWIAREVLPNATSVHLVAMANLSSLRHFWELRAERGNTPEIIKLAKLMFKEVERVMPEVGIILDKNYGE